MSFKFKSTTVASEDLYYDLFDGGINPDKLLADKAQAKEVKDAIALIKSFLEEAEENGAIEVL